MLNKEHFVLLAGDPTAWDNETLALRERQASSPAPLTSDMRDNDLCSLQASQYQRGKRAAELGQNIHGWCVRSGYGFDNWARLSPNFPTRDEAIGWGTQWANEDPTNREFYAHKDLMSR